MVDVYAAVEVLQLEHLVPSHAMLSSLSASILEFVHGGLFVHVPYSCLFYNTKSMYADESIFPL